METITVTYKVKWVIKGNEKYVFTSCGKLFNINNNREIKKTVKGLTPGYWVGREFVSLNKLRPRLELAPKKEYAPF